MASLFAFHLNYVPVHLATEAHLGDLLASITHLVFHEHHHGNRDNEASHHLPHPAADHASDIVAGLQSVADAPVICALLPDLTIPLPEVPLTFLCPPVERLKPPGESPPDPLQPRASATA